MNRKMAKTGLVARICRDLDRERDELDAGTTARLRSIRYAALDSMDSRSVALGRWLRTPALALAATVAIVLSVTFFRSSEQLTVPLGAADLEILTAGEPLELYDNFDFYRWLADRDLHAG